MQHEDRQQRSLPSTPERNKAAPVAHLQRTKDPELHPLPPRHRYDRRAGAEPPAYHQLTAALPGHSSCVQTAAKGGRPTKGERKMNLSTTLVRRLVSGLALLAA